MKNKKIFIGIGVLAIVAFFVVFNVINASKNTGGTTNLGGGKVTPVSVKQIEKGSISSSVSAAGIVIEKSKTDIFFDTSLKINKLNVVVNQRVKKGDPLLDVDTKNLEDELKQLILQKEIQELTISKVKEYAGLANIKSSIEQAKNSVDMSKRALQDSIASYERTKTLFESGIASKSELERAEKMKKDAESSYNTAQNSYMYAMDNYENSIKNTDVDYQIQIKNLETLKLRIENLEAKLQNIKKLVLSPENGIVYSINAVEGGMTSAVQPTFTIMNVEHLQVKAFVNEYNIKQLSKGQKVVITGESLEGLEEVTGIVESVSPIARVNRTTGGEETVVDVIINFDRLNDVIRPGINVDCEIKTIQKDDVIIAEQDILKDDKDGKQYAMVVDTTTNTVSKKYVELGVYSDFTVEIISGLNENETVVVDPQPTLKDGSRVKIIK